jgi:hypothetical protein
MGPGSFPGPVLAASREEEVLCAESADVPDNHERVLVKSHTAPFRFGDGEIVERVDPSLGEGREVDRVLAGLEVADLATVAGLQDKGVPAGADTGCRLASVAPQEGNRARGADEHVVAAPGETIHNLGVTEESVNAAKERARAAGQGIIPALGAGVHDPAIAEHDVLFEYYIPAGQHVIAALGEAGQRVGVTEERVVGEVTPSECVGAAAGQADHAERVAVEVVVDEAGEVAVPTGQRVVTAFGEAAHGLFSVTEERIVDCIAAEGIVAPDHAVIAALAKVQQAAGVANEQIIGVVRTLDGLVAALLPTPQGSGRIAIDCGHHCLPPRVVKPCAVTRSIAAPALSGLCNLRFMPVISRNGCAANTAPQ